MRRKLSDDEWELIEPFLPIGRYGLFPRHLRERFEGVIWRFCTSSRWREMPEEFGAWQTVCGRLAQWRDIGVFAALMEGMIAEAARRGQAGMSLVSVDSTVARAHHDAAGMVAEPEVLAALEGAAARERGHGNGQIAPVAVGSPAGESERAERGRDGGRPVAHDAEQYKERNMVERCVNKIRHDEAPATRVHRLDAQPRPRPAAAHVRPGGGV